MGEASTDPILQCPRITGGVIGAIAAVCFSLLAVGNLDHPAAVAAAPAEASRPPAPGSASNHLQHRVSRNRRPGFDICKRACGGRNFFSCCTPTTERRTAAPNANRY